MKDIYNEEVTPGIYLALSDRDYYNVKTKDGDSLKAVQLSTRKTIDVDVMLSKSFVRVSNPPELLKFLQEYMTG